MAPPATIIASDEAGTLVLRAAGDWLVTEAAGLDRRLRALKVPPGHAVVIDAAGIERLGTARARLLLRTQRTPAPRGHARTPAAPRPRPPPPVPPPGGR